MHVWDMVASFFCFVHQERIAGAKLMVSLMSSEDPILECISEGLLEARDVLSTVSSLDPSIEVQQLCQKMLPCLLSSSWVHVSCSDDVPIWPKWD